jgi:hypothetical protein
MKKTQRHQDSKTQRVKKSLKKRLSPLTLPALGGGKYLGGSLRREDIYDDEKR